MTVQNLIAIHPIVGGTFQSEPKWQTKQQTDVAIPGVVQVKWLTIYLFHKHVDVDTDPQKSS